MNRDAATGDQPPTTDHRPYDLVIVGGGLIGGSLACALAATGLRIALVEAVAADAALQPSYDERVLALAWGSRRILEGIGLWDATAPEAEPIRQVHVGERGQWGFARLDPTELAVPALGYVVPARALGAAIRPALDRAPGVELLCPARVIGLRVQEDLVSLEVQCADGLRDVQARLVVAADGGDSAVRRTLGIAAEERPYGHDALITTVTPDRPRPGWAFERFTDSGPLAMLPMTAGRWSVVWTCREAETAGLLALPDDAFLARLQERFGYRLGRLDQAAPRRAYPLKLLLTRETVHPRLVLIGNAAHTLHPVAGQGFNLGLRDVAALAEVLALAAAAGTDPGAPPVLAAYQAWRGRDQQTTAALTDTLARLFLSPWTPLRLARNLGLTGLDLLPPARRLLARRFMGQTGRTPRLARGLALATGPAATPPAPPAAPHPTSSAPNARVPLDYDVVVVGGGMVGAAFALACAGKGLRIAVVEARAPRRTWPTGEVDLRVSALSRASQRLLERLGAWGRIAELGASPYRQMRVWDALGGGSIHFDAADLGEPDLGHIVENRVIQLALWERLEALPEVTLVCPATIADLQRTPEGHRLVLADGRRLGARLLVGADGRDSLIRELAKIPTRGWDYDQRAIVATVTPAAWHEETAWQRFLPTGPLALLPLADGRCSIVWSATGSRADALLALDDLAFADALTHATQGRLGRLRLDSPRAAVSLRLQHATRYVEPGLALIGDAAHAVHPLAGQGVNLGFLDAAELVAALDWARARHRDPASLATLRRYERARRGDNLAMLAAMDALKRLFGTDLAPAVQVRSLGLGLADRLSPLKRLFMDRALGLSAGLPPLARP